MRIQLILPAAEHLRINRETTEIPRREMLRFSLLPLLTVAASTPDKHHVEIIDENVEAIDFGADVDVVGLSVMTAVAPRAYEIATAFRRRGVVTVAGGYHPTFMPEEARRHVDAVVVGDAEELWPKVLEDVKAGTIAGVYRHEKPPELSNRPLPRRDLMRGNARRYATINAVQTGRGCRHGCRYCSVTAFHGQTYRVRSVRDVIDELIQLDGNVIFVDDNIIANPRRSKRLFQAMIPLKKRWVSQCSITIADDPELLDLAKRAGCVGLFIGVESVKPENLRNVDKGFNQCDQYRRQIKTIRRKGIGVIAGIIVGMDGDDVSVFSHTLRFLEQTGIDALQLNIMTPLPGTPLFEEFEETGRIISRDWSNYDFRHVVFRPARMSRRELREGADWLYARFYRLDKILLRAARTLVEAGPLPALLGLKLNLTYRYDNLREGIRGRDPAKARRRARPTPTAWLRLLVRRVTN